MNPAGAELEALLAGMFWQGALVFLRVGAVVSLLPAFGERQVPMRVKLGAAVMFTLIVAPAAPAFDAPRDLWDFVKLALSETAVGVLLGLTVRLFVLALQTAGSIAAQSTSLSQILGGAAAEPMPAMGHVLVVAGLALAVLSGLHVQAARLMIGSYSLFPPGRPPDPSLVSAWGSARVAEAFALAFMLAAPFVIASVIYNLALGAINRAMPQLMVAFVGAPVVTLGGLLLLLLAAPAALSVWLAALSAFLANPAAPSP